MTKNEPVTKVYKRKVAGNVWEPIAVAFKVANTAFCTGAYSRAYRRFFPFSDAYMGRACLDAMPNGNMRELRTNLPRR